MAEKQPSSVSCLQHAYFNSSRKCRLRFEAFARPELFTEASGLKRHAARHVRASENLRVALTQGAESRGRSKNPRSATPSTNETCKGFWKHNGTSTICSSIHSDVYWWEHFSTSTNFLEKFEQLAHQRSVRRFDVRCVTKFYTSKDFFKSWKQWHIDELFVFLTLRSVSPRQVLSKWSPPRQIFSKLEMLQNWHTVTETMCEILQNVSVD